MINVSKLKNGVTLVVNDTLDLPCVYVDFKVAAGSRYEKENEHGLAHFCEHMMFRGTNTWSYDELREAMYLMGDTLNAWTDTDEIDLYGKFLEEEALTGVKMISEMMFCPRLDPASFIKEKEVVLQEHSMYDDNHNELAQEALQEFQFAGTQLQHPIRGDYAKIQDITLAQMTKYWLKNICPQNLVVSLTGDFSGAKHGALAEMTAVIENISSAAGKSQKIKPLLPQPGITHVNKPESEQVYVHLAVGIPRHKITRRENICISLVNQILGGGFKSRLFTQVRDELGLTYDVGSSWTTLDKTGFVTVGGSATPEKAYDLVNESYKVWLQLCREGVTETELEQAKHSQVVNWVFMAESRQLMTLWSARSHRIWGEVLSVDEMKAEIRSITMDDVQKVLKKYFKGKPLAVLTFGPNAKQLRRKIKGTLTL